MRPMSNLAIALLGGFVGGVLGVVGTIFSSYYGPRKLEQWRRNEDERTLDGPRKDLLRTMLGDERYKDGRYLQTLRIVTGTTEEECRRLLIQIGARGVLLKDGEGWALIANKPLGIER